MSTDPTPAVLAVVQAARFWKSKRDRLQYPPPRLSSALDGETCSIPEARALYDAVAELDRVSGANDERSVPAAATPGEPSPPAETLTVPMLCERCGATPDTPVGESGIRYFTTANLCHPCKVARTATAAAITDDRVETAARVLHDRRHPGYGHVCDRCRADARAVADVLTPKETR